MGDKTLISWCDATWNPVRGCSRQSQGCKGCYAEGVAARFSDPGQAYHGYAERGRPGSAWTGKVDLVPEMLDVPGRWKRPRKIFVNSMSDLFHPNLPFGKVMRVWNAMALADQHAFQVLTKRTDRMAEFLRSWRHVEDDFDFKDARTPEAVRATYPEGRGELFAQMLEAMGAPPPGCAPPSYDWMQGMRCWPDVLPNVWMGWSAEDQDTFDERWGHMQEAAWTGQRLMVSAEPLLGPIVLPASFFLVPHKPWVIIGGESGPKARPMRREWAERLVAQCRDGGLPVWMKQAGANRGPDWNCSFSTRKGDELAEMPDSLRVRELPLEMVR